MMKFVEVEFITKGIKISFVERKKEIGRARLYLIWNDLHDKPYALLEDVFVDEKFRRKGIGTKIVKKAIEIAKKMNCYKIIATSRYKRKEVHKFYLKNGFKDWGKEFRLDL